MNKQAAHSPVHLEVTSRHGDRNIAQPNSQRCTISRHPCPRSSTVTSSCQSILRDGRCNSTAQQRRASTSSQLLPTLDAHHHPASLSTGCPRTYRPPSLLSSTHAIPLSSSYECTFPQQVPSSLRCQSLVITLTSIIPGYSPVYECSVLPPELA